jgi:hypothetical protein
VLVEVSHSPSGEYPSVRVLSLAAIMENVFAKIAENTVKFNLGDEEASKNISAFVLEADHV